LEEQEEEAPVVPAATGVKIRAVKNQVPVCGARSKLLEDEADDEVEEEEDAADEELVEDEEEPITEQEEEEVDVAELELETAPFEVVEPIISPVVAVTHELSGDLNGMDVQVAAPEEAVLSEDQIESKLQEFGEYDPTAGTEQLRAAPDRPARGPWHRRTDGDQGRVGGQQGPHRGDLGPLQHRHRQDQGDDRADGDAVRDHPAGGVRISKIKNLEDDIALSLAALGIRIIAPIPGKGTIGIEVPNSKPQVVGMRAVIASEKFQNSGMDLPLVLGKTISNETFVTDLTKMPHLLMAGATGQGKSVGLNAILVIAALQEAPEPDQVRAGGSEEGGTHPLQQDRAALPGQAARRQRRHHHRHQEGGGHAEQLVHRDGRALRAAEGCAGPQHQGVQRQVHQRRLNPENGHRYLPYIVLVVDEFADLIMTAGREVETPIARLAQLARAIGIHLIIATQRPSVNIITGTIKANFPARIAFRVTSKIDSRTILDAGGADQLIGRGDMLLSTGNDLIRIQCAFVDTPEVDKICDFIGNQRGYPDALILPEVPTEEGEGGVDLDDGDRDSMFEDAARLVVQTQQGSTS
jgi:S-DNA-T family DNA segregation ATPase FtsK/SpoIIIE